MSILLSYYPFKTSRCHGLDTTNGGVNFFFENVEQRIVKTAPKHAAQWETGRYQSTVELPDFFRLRYVELADLSHLGGRVLSQRHYIISF